MAEGRRGFGGLAGGKLTPGLLNDNQLDANLCDARADDLAWILFEPDGEGSWSSIWVQIPGAVCRHSAIILSGSMMWEQGRGDLRAPTDIGPISGSSGLMVRGAFRVAFDRVWFISIYI